MPLPAGTKLGPYQIEGLVGAGGMGEVYRAHDSRVGRDVAVKIVPIAVAADVAALSRFEREARAVATISHPNIVALYEFGTSDGMSYAVMELLEGESLRARLASGPLPLRKAVDIAAQIAHGLAAAHAKHIAHRDLKPENVFIATDGTVKILDFGLARQTEDASSGAPDAPTVAPATEPGVVLGTVGYMAPEQVRGERSDHRSDVFALGCILHEMLTGRRAFDRGTAAETMTAILREEPSPPVSTVPGVPPAVERILDRCLEKRADERFQSARDLAFALESSLDARSGSGVGVAGPVRAGRRWRTGAALLGIGLAAGAAIGVFAARRSQPATSDSAAPQFHQLTFDRGTIRDARFAPDGRSILYSAAWNGAPLRVFMTRTDSTESVRLTLPDARLLSVSRSTELAISLGHRFEGWIGAGTLARTSVLGSAPRVLAEDVREAEWTPDGSDLAIVRRSGTLECLEFPIGNVLYRTSGYISDIRFSLDGSRIAFADHPLFADDAGFISMVDRAGRRTVLTPAHETIHGLAWSRDGNEVWYSGRKGQFGIFAVTTAGTQRTVWASPSGVKLFDVAPDGTVLLGRETADRRIEALFAGAAGPVDVTLRANSSGHWISDDGTAVTIADQATRTYSAYLKKAGTDPVLLGEGQPRGVSADGRWLLAIPLSGAPLLLHPTGAGQTKKLPNPDNLVFDSASWLPDGRHVVMSGQLQGGLSKGYVQNIDGGPPRPFTPEGVRAARWWLLPVSADGSRIVAVGTDGKQSVIRISDGSSTPIPGLKDDDLVVQWSADGRSVLTGRGNGQPWQVDRVDLASGQRTPVLEIRAPDGAGLRLSVFGITPDGRHYVHGYSRLLTDLFFVQGLR